MLGSTLELITQAASNSVFIFCICNLIIVIILVGSKPVSNNDERSKIRITKAASSRADDEQGMEEAKHAWKEKNGLMQVSELVENEQNASADDGKFSSTEGDSEDDETDTDDELRTRAEEFIEKVNKAWKAEVLRTSCVF